MCVQDSEKALHNAVAAAKQYVKLKKECRDRHEAFIGVSVNGQDKHGVKKVFVDVTDENVKIRFVIWFVGHRDNCKMTIFP